MTDKDYDKLKQIELAVQTFDSKKLYESSIALLKSLDYQSTKTDRLHPASFEGFMNAFGIAKNVINPEKALTSDWKQIEFIFQVTTSEVTRVQSLFDTNTIDRSEFQSFLFFSIQLKEESYKRGDLVKITREINLPFKMPVIVLFQYGNKLTLSIIDRRLHKKDISKDVLEKVTLIKDIDIANPQRAHKEILKDLSLDELFKKYEFHSFVQLHEAWKATLNISELNKKFFFELTNWYFWALGKVSFPDDLEKRKEIRNATNLIRLITRVVFIWFIKEKSLVPEELFKKSYLSKILKGFNKNEKSEDYYKAILQNLFFGTLNQKMGVRKFAKEKDFITNSEEYGVKNLFRYASLFSLTETEVIQVFEQVPFLNGGLFDCLDKENENKKVVYVDGFSRNEKKQAKVPDYIFFSEEREVDLTEFYDPKAKKKSIRKVRGLFNILESYKFTITENTPIEEEIALDPELLGKVFENLLASFNPETQTTARKQTGSFYTPREIVNYMVDESLLEYLKQNENPNGIAKENEKFESQIRELLSYSHLPNSFDEIQTKSLIEAINSCKILDPACGSGAYPMGILHKMVHLLQKLDPENIFWKAQQRENIIGEQIRLLEKDREAIQGLSDTAVRAKAEKAVKTRLNEVEEIFESKNNYDDYARKLYLIENCIYGIDIQPIAVQISKLRFFISLIIDQNKLEKKENYGIRSLPNLETKFVAANTLIGLDIPTTDLFAENNPVKKLENDLKKVRHEYFAASNRKEKLRLQNEDKKLRKQISDLIKDQLTKKGDSEIEDLKATILKEKNDLKNLEKTKEGVEIVTVTDIFGRITHTKTDRKAIKLKLQKDRINYFEKELHVKENSNNKDEIAKVADQIATFDPYNQNTYANWFDPEWMFGLTTNFEIIIGNPPWGAKLLAEEKELFKISYPKIDSSTPNTFSYFIGWAFNNYDCVISFVLPDSILIKDFSKTREYIKDFVSEIIWYENSGVSELNKKFVYVDHDVCVINIFKQKSIDLKYSLHQFDRSENKIVEKRFFHTKSKIILEEFDFSYNLIAQDKDLYILSKISNFEKLDDFMQCHEGIHSGNSREKLFLEKEKNKFCKPLFYGGGAGDIIQNYHSKRYGWYVDYRAEIIDKSEGYYASLRDERIFSNPKIYISRTGNPFKAFYDEKTYASNNFFSLQHIDYSKNNGVSLKRILPFIISKPAQYFIRTFAAPRLGSTFIETKIFHLLKFRIPKLEELEKFPFNPMVDYVILQKNLDTDSTFFERLLDAMVYELYFPEEINAGGAAVLNHLGNLPELTEDQDENLKITEKVYKELSDPVHVVSTALLKLLTIEEVNIIEGRA